MSPVWAVEGDCTGEGRRRKREEERRRTDKGKMEGKEAKGRWSRERAGRIKKWRCLKSKDK